MLTRRPPPPPAGVRRAADPYSFRAPVAALECSGETAPDADVVPMRHPEGIGCSFGGNPFFFIDGKNSAHLGPVGLASPDEN